MLITLNNQLGCRGKAQNLGIHILSLFCGGWGSLEDLPPAMCRCVQEVKPRETRTVFPSRLTRQEEVVLHGGGPESPGFLIRIEGRTGSLTSAVLSISRGPWIAEETPKERDIRNPEL